jgi:hypothetical protein
MRLPVGQPHIFISKYSRLSDRGSFDHAFKDHFKSHGVAAAPSGLEKVAIAGPVPILILYSVRVVCPVKRHRKVIKVNPVPLLGVALGLLNFANHARIHGKTTPFGIFCRWMQKARVKDACLKFATPSVRKRLALWYHTSVLTV